MASKNEQIWDMYENDSCFLLLPLIDFKHGTQTSPAIRQTHPPKHAALLDVCQSLTYLVQVNSSLLALESYARQTGF